MTPEAEHSVNSVQEEPEHLFERYTLYLVLSLLMHLFLYLTFLYGMVGGGLVIGYWILSGHVKLEGDSNWFVLGSLLLVGPLYYSRRRIDQRVALIKQQLQRQP